MPHILGPRREATKVVRRRSAVGRPGRMPATQTQKNGLPIQWTGRPPVIVAF